MRASCSWISSALFLLLSVSARAGAGAGSPPNVILISLDTLRADALGIYDSSRKSLTPNLDAFGRESALFIHSYSSSNVTLQSHLSIFTGLLPDHHHVTDINLNMQEAWSKAERLEQALAHVAPLGPSIKTLGELLHQQGYKTSWFAHSTDNSLDVTLGFARGIDDLEPLGLDSRVGLKRAVDWLSRNRKNRFFAFIHSKIPHQPYTAIERSEYRAALGPDTGLPAAEPISNGELNGLWQAFLGRERASDLSAVGLTISIKPCFPLKGAKEFLQTELPPSKFADYVYCRGLGKVHDFSRLKMYYDYNVRYADKLFGELLEGIKAAGLYDRSLIIVTSDHGESLYEHEVFGHGNSLYREQLAVPLMIHLPGAAPVKVVEQVQATDLLPTILDAVGAGAKARGDGHSVLEAVRGHKIAERPVMATGLHRGHMASAILSDSWKLIKGYEGSLELYDLRKDPAENHNLAPASPDRVHRLDAELMRQQLGHSQ